MFDIDFRPLILFLLIAGGILGFFLTYLFTHISISWT